MINPSSYFCAVAFHREHHRSCMSSEGVANEHTMLSVAEHVCESMAFSRNTKMEAWPRAQLSFEAYPLLQVRVCFSCKNSIYSPKPHFFFFFEKCRVSPTYDTNTNLYQSNIKIRLPESLPRGKASFLPLKRFNK